ncbi:hypothetical protein GCM10018787_51630 [Streptomyces thermodiastaticus]|nr:hypothetical protein GCM10018787_51630 [Streptomyces thermodiastaticus]
MASSGPRTKVSSSVTDSKAAAVAISGEPFSTTPQRARTMGPICGTEAPVGTAAANSAHRGGVGQGERGQPRGGQCVDQDAGEQDGALPVTVGQAPAEGREQGHGDAGDGRGGAGRAIGTGGVLHEQHDGEREHRERLTCREARQQERPGAAGAQQLPVSRAGGSRRLLRRSGAGDRGSHGPSLSAAW